MRTRRTATVLIAAVAVAGCSSSHEATSPPPTTTTVTTPRTDAPPPRNAQERAVEACAKVAPKYFVNAEATTVGAIHAIAGGPGNVHGYTWILKGVPPQSFAAWCWRKTGAHNYKGYVVGPNGEVVDTGQGYGSSEPPGPGPLPIT